jgi:hypothetical protein
MLLVHCHRSLREAPAARVGRLWQKRKDADEAIVLP